MAKEKKEKKQEEKKPAAEEASKEEKSETTEEAKDEGEQAEEPSEKIEKTEEEFVKKGVSKSEEERARRLESWAPRTKLGKEVREGKIKDIKEIFDAKRKIMESQIVDSLLNTTSDLLLIGQSKGKFGGGKRRAWRQTQKKTAEGNQPSFACMYAAGDGHGYVGIGYGKGKETLPAREKAERNAKLSLIKVRRGCGSFDCSCGEEHSIPFKVEGKCGSARMILMPAPRGTGLVIEDECKKVLKLAGIKDVYSKSFGQTRTKINLVKACFNALKNLEKIRK